MLVLVVVVIMCLYVFRPHENGKTKSYPSNEESYKFVNNRVGCDSNLSDNKKQDIFTQEYKNHRMTWNGKIVLVSSDDVSINIDGKGTQDLQVAFKDKGAGYNLLKGQTITVSFIMRRVGGCVLPFSGDLGVVQ